MCKPVAFGIGVLLVVASSIAPAAEKPLDWRELMTLAQEHPKTDLQWGMGKPQLLQRHPQLQNADSRSHGFFLTESVTEDGCSFVVEARSDGKSQALDYVALKLAHDTPSACAEQWRAQLLSLYGKPADSGPVQDIVRDADTPIRAEWNTPTSCIRLLYTRADAPHPGPLTVTFGNRSSFACGYTDQVVTTVPRDRPRR